MDNSEREINHLLPLIKRFHKRTSSVVVILTLPDARVVTVKAHYKAYWSFPGGLIDDGETPAQAGVREVEEEIGLVIAQEKLRFALVVDRESPQMRTYQFVFEYDIAAEEVANIVLDKTELSEYALVSKLEILGNDDRVYSQTARHWAAGLRGYEEQVFGAGK